MSRINRGTQGFAGFGSPTYTMVPDELFDELLGLVSGAELKVLLYIIRRTFGFKKDSDSISFNQFLTGITTKDGHRLDQGCGIKSRSHLSTALKNLEVLGAIVAQKSWDERGENQTTVYTLRFRREGVVPKSNYPGAQIAPPVVPKSHPQQTVVQETEKQHDVVVNALREAGISEAAATRLARDHDAAYILAKVDLIHWLQEHRPTTVGKNPAGALRRAIEDDWAPPLSYQPPEQRAALAQQRAAERTAEQHHQQALDQEHQRSQEETAQQLAVLCPPESIPGSSLNTTAAWDQARTILEAEMTAGNFSFVKQARLARCDGHVALVVAPYSYHLDQLSGRFHPLITHALNTVLGTPIHCEYTTLSRLAEESPRHPTGAAADGGDAHPERATGPSQEPLAPREPNGHHPQPRRGRPPKTELAAGP